MRILAFYRSSLGKKFVAAVTGAIMVLFLIAHMLGNLNIYSGAAKIDAYSLYLRTFMEGFFGFGGFLWIARVVLVVCLVLHILSVGLLIRQNRQARPIHYRHKKRFASTLAGATMVLTGPWILAYIVLHILQFTTGTVQPTPFEVTPEGIGAVYFNLWNAFQVWWIAGLYVVSMAFICMHLYHGIWSMCQSVGWNNHDRNGGIRIFATICSVGLFIGFSSVPVLVWTDVVPPPASEYIQNVADQTPADSLLTAEGRE